jgi:hypothetical protein
VDTVSYGGYIMNHCIETDPDNPCVVGSVAYTTICLAIGMETASYIKNQQQQKTQTNKQTKQNKNKQRKIK